MPAKKYLRNVGGDLTETPGTVVSTGAPQAGDLVALDDTGHWDPSTAPAGFGADIETMPASEALVAGALVNVFSNAGVANARNADASAANGGKRADGFVIAAVASSGSATVYLWNGRDTGVSGLVAGTSYFLSATTPGAVTATAPTQSGYISQRVGKAITATNLNVAIEKPIILA